MEPTEHVHSWHPACICGATGGFAIDIEISDINDALRHELAWERDVVQKDLEEQVATRTAERDQAREEARRLHEYNLSFGNAALENIKLKRQVERLRSALANQGNEDWWIDRVIGDAALAGQALSLSPEAGAAGPKTIRTHRTGPTRAGFCNDKNCDCPPLHDDPDPAAPTEAEVAGPSRERMLECLASAAEYDHETDPDGHEGNSGLCECWFCEAAKIVAGLPEDAPCPQCKPAAPPESQRSTKEK
jgi:hypothetical protein